MNSYVMVQAQILGCPVTSLGSLDFKARAENTAPTFLTRTSTKVPSSLKASKTLNSSNQTIQSYELSSLSKKLLKSDFLLPQY